ncbi:MAG: putative baseplate assembly protein [Dehalococcoidia bacterium]
MPLPDPKLDDRTFQDFVNETKALIPQYAPEWTDHNVHDPGVTLIELFSYLAESLLYRLNRVPEKNYLRFLDLLGIRLKDAVPARTTITFRLSAAQPAPLTIPRGTEVATVRTGEAPAISFATDRDLVLFPPTLRQMLSSFDDTNYLDLTERLRSEGDYFQAFQAAPIPGDALYLGFAENLSAHIANVDIDCEVEGIGVDPLDPPLSWEAWCGNVRSWVRCEVERDDTGGLNTTGGVTLLLPDGMEPRALAGQTCYWVRVRVVQARPRQPAYSSSPRINTVGPSVLGGYTEASHAAALPDIVLGRATGVPGETFELPGAPLLPRRADEHVEVQEEREDGPHWVAWQEVPSFRGSNPSDRHYQVDGVTGTVSFGPTIRQPEGGDRAFGARLERGQMLRMTRYRVGGGVAGNVGANTLTVLKSSIPFVATVTNRQPATGGLDPETVDAAKFRAPAEIRSRDRAVTVEDYEFLAHEASRIVARAKCIQVRQDSSGGNVPPGMVELLIVPLLPDDHERTVESLQPSQELLTDVREYLDERRLLGTQLVVDGPAYIGVRVEATIAVQRNVDPETVRAEVLGRLRRHLDPIHGGPDGLGWPFGRDLYLAEVQSIVQSVRGVEYAQDVTLYQIDLQTNQTRAAGQRIALAEDVLLLPFEHTVTVARRDR